MPSSISNPGVLQFKNNHIIKEAKIMSKKVVIIGGVAGGASCAARLRRLDEDAEIIVFERGPYVSFANCGLPYHVGGTIPKRANLLVVTPDLLDQRFRINIRSRQEVLRIDRTTRQVLVKDLESDQTYLESYDYLVLAPGAAPVRPPIPGSELPGVFTIRTIPDTDTIIAWIEERQAREVVVIGAGFIGLEMAENFQQRGLTVSVVEQANQVLPISLDYEMAALAQAELVKQGIALHFGEQVQEIRSGDGQLLVRTGKRTLSAGLVLLAVGLRPETTLARDAGLEIGPTGGIKTDGFLRTSDPKIFAVGDAIEVTNPVNSQPSLIPLAGPANRQGRLAADNICGRQIAYRGTAGTSIIKLFDLAVAATGLNARQLQRAGIEYRSVIVHPLTRAGYYPGGSQISLKLLFSPVDGRILGAQAIGREGADKRIDVLTTALQASQTVYDLEQLELAYAPPFSSARDPINQLGMAASNIVRGDVSVVAWDELDFLLNKGSFLLDVRTPSEVQAGTIEGAVHIPVDSLRDRLGEIPSGHPLVVYCASGLRSYIACRILKAHGWHEVYNLSGGWRTYHAATGARSQLCL
jgi:NADPH-dependent 2,4-dienoyl-CoA reductase/sulfur reductase-like enzyme/rhodanese-related sulfurtransferase